MKYTLALLLLVSTSALAESKHMKLDSSIGGYLTIMDEPCEIEAVKNDYPFKVIIENGSGETRRACWNNAEQHWNDRFESNVIIKEEIPVEDGNVIFLTGSFVRYYFKDTK